MIAIDVIPGFAALPSLRRSWNDVFQSRPHEPSTSYEWTCALARHHVKAEDQCFLIRLRREGEVVGLVPLIARRATLRLGVRATILAPLSEAYNTHSDLLLRDTDDDTIRAFVSGLIAVGVQWDSFTMARLIEESPLAASLQRVLRTEACRYSLRDGVPAYVLPLPPAYGEYLQGRSAKFRNHLRRVEKKLATSGSIEVKQVTGETDLDDALRALLEVERASWKHEHGSSIAAVERQALFYADFAREALGAGRLHLQWMTLDGRPIAYNLGFLHGAAYHYLKTSYAAALRPLSPATVLRARLIEDLIGLGVTVFDFPGEPYSWEAQWTEHLRWRQTLSLYRPTIVGHLLALSARLRRPVPRTVEHLDPRSFGPPASHA